MTTIENEDLLAALALAEENLANAIRHIDICARKLNWAKEDYAATEKAVLSLREKFHAAGLSFDHD